MIKRNSVVTDERDPYSGWTPFGRVVTIKNGLALVIFVTRDYDWIPVEKLKEYDYKGRWHKYYLKSYWDLEDRSKEEDHIYWVWYNMSSLRKLKQRASFYYPEIWKEAKKDRK